MEEGNVNLSQRERVEVIYTDLTVHEPGIDVHGIPVFDGTVTATFEDNENGFINITPLIDEGVDSVKALFFH